MLIQQAVLELPPSTITLVAEALTSSQAGGWTGLRHRAQTATGNPAARSFIGMLIGRWQSEAPDVTPTGFALALQAAAKTADHLRRTQTTEVVWTGPDTDLPLRQTAQALQEVIYAAQQDLLVVSYAVYDIPDIVQALAETIRRGVRLRLVIESPEAAVGQAAYHAIAAFGPELLKLATIYRWPKELRPTHSGSGKPAALHVKCAVADMHALLLSSANLTHYALNLNMEMGILIRGGPLPGQVTRHFLQLIEQRVLVPVELLS